MILSFLCPSMQLFQNSLEKQNIFPCPYLSLLIVDASPWNINAEFKEACWDVPGGTELRHKSLIPVYTPFHRQLSCPDPPRYAHSTNLPTLVYRILY